MGKQVLVEAVNDGYIVALPNTKEAFVSATIDGALDRLRTILEKDDAPVEEVESTENAESVEQE